MPMFLCRWPNGDFSVVTASNETDAVARLHEHAEVEPVELWQMPDCLITFQLDNLGDFELCGFGALTTKFINDNCYPALAQAIREAERDENDGCTPMGLNQIRDAVEHERTRAEIPAPELECSLQPTDTPAPSQVIVSMRWVRRG
jgi:hypothetical protein